MLCKNPFMGGAVPFGCGQCFPCRINRRRQWMWRQYFESLTHDDNCFVTLTYSDAYLPYDCSLQPYHLTTFLKRLRYYCEPLKFRYFACGEYGEGGMRVINPHYHLSIFGLSGFTDWHGRNQKFYGCAELINRAWGFGNVDVKPFEEKTAQYVAGYVIKKMTNKDDDRLEGRAPEFARMSRMPALGSAAMAVVAKQLSDNWHLFEENGLPNELQIGKKKLRLGRTLLRKLREAMGFTDEYIELVKSNQTLTRSIELLPVRLRAQADASSSLRKEIIKENQQAILNVESRATVYKKRNVL